MSQPLPTDRVNQRFHEMSEDFADTVDLIETRARGASDEVSRARDTSLALALARRNGPALALAIDLAAGLLETVAAGNPAILAVAVGTFRQAAADRLNDGEALLQKRGYRL